MEDYSLTILSAGNSACYYSAVEILDEFHPTKLHVLLFPNCSFGLNKKQEYAYLRWSGMRSMHVQ